MGAYFGKSSKGWFFGFQLPLTCDDRLPALLLVQAVDGGVPLGDWGYRGPEWAMALAQEAEMLLLTRDQAPTHRFVLSHVRQRVETTFSQLWRKFVDRVFRRSWSGLWNTLQLKVLYYNLRHAGVLSA
jgi:predicted GNAT family acetyltransferase